MEKKSRKHSQYFGMLCAQLCVCRNMKNSQTLMQARMTSFWKFTTVTEEIQQFLISHIAQ